MPRLFEVRDARPRPVPNVSSLSGCLVAFVLTATPWATPALAQSVDADLWVTNGSVRAIAHTGDLVYLGGQFTRVGPATGRGAPFDLVVSTPSSGFPKVVGSPGNTGYVSCAIPDGSGGWYIGGSFAWVGGLPRTNLAHIKPDLTVDAAFAPVPDLSVMSMALSGSVLYVGGAFTFVNGVARSHLAAIDVTTGALTAWSPAVDNSVRTLAVSGSVVYAGGDFLQASGLSRLRLAAFDATTGAVSSWAPNADNIVEVIVVNGSVVFAGGSFTNIGGAFRPRLAAINASTGTATSWDPTCNGNVTALAVGGTQLYVGGFFTQIGGQSRSGLASVDIGTAAVSAWNPSPSAAVRAIAADGSDIWVGGDFLSVGGQSRAYVALLDASTGAAMPWNPNLDANVLTLARSGSRVYVGGAFRSAGSVPRNNLAAFQISTGSVASWDPNVSGAVQALALSGDTVYVGGLFIATGGGTTRNRIAAFHRTTGALTSFNPNANGSVYALAVHGSTVYAAGDFTTMGGVARNRLAALKTDGTLWPWNPNADGSVRALLVDRTTVYVGGYFTTVGGITRNRAAAIDSTTGSPNGFHPDANGPVHALALMDSRVYAGGEFTVIGLAARNRVAALDASSGVAYGWDPYASGPVYAMAVTPSLIYLGGSFSQIGGQARDFLAAVEIPTGILKSWNPSAERGVLALAKQDSLVFAGGNFASVGVFPQASIAAIEAIPEVTSIANPFGGNGGPVTVVLRGQGFRFGATGKLVRTGEADIVGTSPAVAADGASLTTTFDLTGKAPGGWYAIVTNPGGMVSSLSLLGAYLVQAVQGPQLRVSVVGPDSIRAGVPTPFDMVIENPGNVDAAGVPLWITGIPTNATVGLDFVSSPPPQAGGEPSWSSVPATFTSAGGQYLPLLIPRVPPGTVTRRITLNVPISSPLFQLAGAVAPPWANESVFLGCLQSGGVIANPTCAGTQLGAIQSYLSSNPQIEAMSGTGIWAKVAWQCEGAGTLAAAIAKSEQVLDFLDGPIESGTAASGCQDALPPRWRHVMIVRVVSSIDPNDKLSPQGPVSSQQAIPYSIRFENLANAGANTQRVIITDVLSQNLDLATFTLGAVTFGSNQVFPPPGAKQFTWDVDLGPTKGIVVRVLAGFTPSTQFDRTVVWSFTSLDRTTLQPLDPTSLNGFLPPNVNPPEGEGSALFTIKPSSSATNGAQITNSATISFDGTPLTTPVASNTLDNQPPASNVTTLGNPIPDPTFPVSWQGSGPELRDYTVYVSEDGAPYQVWKLNTTTTTGTFTPQPKGHTYSFYSVARDLTGNIETAPSSPDAQTTSTTSVGGEGTAGGLVLVGAQPNPAKGILRVAFTLPGRERARLELLDVAGRRVLRREVGELGPGDHVLTLDPPSSLKSGLYFLRLVRGSIVLQTRVVWMQ